MSPQKFFHIFSLTDLSIEPLNLSQWDGVVNHYEFGTEEEAHDWIAEHFVDANESPQYRLVILPVWQVNSKK
jgi:hypothetical protein